MIPKQAIEKAIEGGWSPKYGHHSDLVDSNGEWIGVENSRVVSYAEIALDPTFWQALGKVLGWVRLTKVDENPTRRAAVPTCNEYAHRFYDLILTSGDTDKFWDEILK